MPDAGTDGAQGTDTQSSDTPGVTNVSDVTSQASGHQTTNVTNGDSQSRPASTQSHVTPGTSDFSGALSRLMDRIDSLPESIANAVREAAPSAPTQTQTPANSGDSAGSGSASAGADGATTGDAGTHSSSRSERFSAWWFGK